MYNIGKKVIVLEKSVTYKIQVKMLKSLNYITILSKVGRNTQ